VFFIFKIKEISNILIEEGTKEMQRNYRNLFIVLLLLISCFTNYQVVEAAKPDRIAPTAPTNLRTTAITDSTVTLSWNISTDNVGVTGYYVYQSNSMIGSASSSQYTVKNLSPNTSYSFYIKARDAKGNLSASSNTIQAVTTGTTTIDQPPQVSGIQVSPIASDGQTVSGPVTLSVSPHITNLRSSSQTRHIVP
jgi:chitinase